MMLSSVILLAVSVIPGAPRCLPPSGEKIVAQDLVVALPAFAQLPPDQVLGFAPQPGVTRTLAPAELMQWLSRHRIVPESPITEPVCVAWPLQAPDARAMQAAMEESLPAGATVRVLEVSQFGQVAGPVKFPIGSLRGAVWKGYVEYLPGVKQEIWARVEIRSVAPRVVAAQSIRAGDVIEESMVRVDTSEGPLPGAGIAEDSAEVVGRVARRALLAGSPIPLDALTKPLAVKKGDPVRISVIAGAARIGLEGVAMGSGAEGELVGVKVAETGRIVRVRVAALGYTVLDLGKK